MVPCEGNRLDHILRVLATHYHRGSAVDHRVPDSPCLVVLRVFRSDEFPMQPACELRKLLIQCRQRSPPPVLMGILGTAQGLVAPSPSRRPLYPPSLANPP